MYYTLSSLFFFILSKIEEVILSFPILKKHFPLSNWILLPVHARIKRKKRYILLLNLVMKGVLTLTEKFDEYKKRDRIDSDYKEEYAAEVAPQRIDYDDKDNDDVRSSAAGSTAGFIALALAILSLFTFPTLFGLVSVLLGIYAYNRGATVTGGTAAIVGGIAALIAILFRVALIGLLFSLF
jgi:hypothetical protein